MNRRRTNPTARLIAAFAVIAVLLASSPVGRAGLCSAESCAHECCQTQAVGRSCCDGEPSHDCPAMVSCKAKVWLPPRASSDEPTPRGFDHSDFPRIIWKTESVTLVRSVSWVRSNSLIDWHVRLQI